jgi:hypothetical protein
MLDAWQSWHSLWGCLRFGPPHRGQGRTGPLPCRMSRLRVSASNLSIGWAPSPFSTLSGVSRSIVALPDAVRRCNSAESPRTGYMIMPGYDYPGLRSANRGERAGRFSRRQHHGSLLVFPAVPPRVDPGDDPDHSALAIGEGYGRVTVAVPEPRGVEDRGVVSARVAGLHGFQTSSWRATGASGMGGLTPACMQSMLIETTPGHALVLFPAKLSGSKSGGRCQYRS